MVAAELVMNQAHTRSGCSARRYQAAVNMEKRGILAASNRPRRNRVASKLPTPFDAAMHAAEVPQQKTKMVMRILGSKRTMMKAENGCQARVAIEVMDEAKEYSCFWSPKSFDKPNALPYPKTVLS